MATREYERDKIIDNKMVYVTYNGQQKLALIYSQAQSAMDEYAAPLEARIKELEAWKESAMNTLQQVDLQGCADALDLKVGDNIPDKILPSLNRLKGLEQHNKGLHDKLQEFISYNAQVSVENERLKRLIEKAWDGGDTDAEKNFYQMGFIAGYSLTQDEWVRVEDGLPEEVWTECLVIAEGKYGQRGGVHLVKSIHIDPVDKMPRGIDHYNKVVLYITHYCIIYRP